MSARPVWSKKRVWMPGAAVLAIGLACAVAWSESRGARVVLYNETGERVLAVRVRACHQSKNLGGLQDEESVEWALGPEGTASDIALEVEMVGERAWTWRGGYLEPAGGYRVVLRLGPGEEVGVGTQVSVWQGIFGSSSVSSPDASPLH